MSCENLYALCLMPFYCRMFQVKYKDKLLSWEILRVHDEFSLNSIAERLRNKEI